jgi:hypothetical protein
MVITVTQRWGNVKIPRREIVREAAERLQRIAGTPKAPLAASLDVA